LNSRTVQRSYVVETVTISGIPKDDFEDVKRKLAKTLHTSPDKLSNKDVVFILCRFFTYWFDNISPKDAFEIRDIVEKLVALKRADEGTYKRTCNRVRRFLDGLMGVFEEMDDLVSELFTLSVREFAEEEVEEDAE